MAAKSSLHCLLLYLLCKDRPLRIRSPGLKPWVGVFIAASWERGFCGMKELEPPSHSIQDILDVSPSTSSELTAGYQWMECTGLPHTRCPCCTTPRDCCHRRLIQQDVDAFPVGSVNWSKSPCGHVIVNARTGARAGRKEEQDQRFDSRLQLNWIKRNTKLYPKKPITSQWFSFVTNTLDWQLKLAGIRMFLCSTDEYNTLLSTQDFTGSFWYIMRLMKSKTW